MLVDKLLDYVRSPGTPSKLAGGVAVIGAATETDEEKRLGRRRVAYRDRGEGIVAGGGAHCPRCLIARRRQDEGDEQIGINIIKRACEEPVARLP
ncbi:MAG: hypothetical protein WKF37_06630 [Bryobacteraceae bacterium]